MNDPQSMLDDASLDAERAAIAFHVLGMLAREMAAALGRANSQYEWFLETANWLLDRAAALRGDVSQAAATFSPAALRLVS